MWSFVSPGQKVIGLGSAEHRITWPAFKLLNSCLIYAWDAEPSIAAVIVSVQHAVYSAAQLAHLLASELS